MGLTRILKRRPEMASEELKMKIEAVRAELEKLETLAVTPPVLPEEFVVAKVGNRDASGLAGGELLPQDESFATVYVVVPSSLGTTGSVGLFANKHEVHVEGTEWVFGWPPYGDSPEEAIAAYLLNPGDCAS